MRATSDCGVSTLGKTFSFCSKFSKKHFTLATLFFSLKQTGLIRCKIIDNDLKNKKLDEAMKDVFPNYRVGDVDFQGKTCFGDFDGQELHFLNTELHALFIISCVGG
jgi:hypothetical protein